MSNVYRYLLTGIALIAVLAGLYLFGYTKGKANAEKENIQLQLEQLQAVIERSGSLTLKAQQTSAALERRVSAQFEANLKTTKEIQHALKTTANTRVSCVFPADVMQQIETARHRATVATTASDVDDLLPSTRRNK